MQPAVCAENKAIFSHLEKMKHINSIHLHKERQIYFVIKVNGKNPRCRRLKP
jgi:hypothetical protein